MIPPVLFIIFNRPDLTLLSFEAIRKAQPRELFIAADGPRPDRPGEADLCNESRKVIELVDWKCNVRTLFRDQNLGCRKAVSGAISWFFESVDEGIILEDDCVVDESFFPFCNELLERFRDDERIMAIGAEGYDNQSKRADRVSYSFSGYPLIWGWATWKRAWEKYDDCLDDLDRLIADQWLLPYLGCAQVSNYWKNQLTMAKDGTLNTWGYRWFVSFWRNHGLCILPSENLVSNIGYDCRGTHTLNPDWNVANRPRGHITFALIHPKDVRRDYVLDSVLNRKRFEIPLAPRPIPAKELVRSIGSGMKELGVRAIRRIRRIFSTKVFGI